MKCLLSRGPTPSSLVSALTLIQNIFSHSQCYNDMLNSLPQSCDKILCGYLITYLSLFFFFTYVEHLHVKQNNIRPGKFGHKNNLQVGGRPKCYCIYDKE